ncbi:DUF995 domain-containing protein [Mesorhizobium sp.]|uniref:DUF995 domain-containing protein n=1 Tax=Mesorhizobium sp. TaxID=1871066 RepID=UPI00257A701B|nr:DUF995 domain-containing protein [Mesorhizobium sp.]
MRPDTPIEDKRLAPLISRWQEVPVALSKSERALLLSGFRMLTAVAWAVSCIAAPAFASSSQVSVLPEGARRMTAGEIYDLYRDKSWQWDSGAGRMVGANRHFSAWTDGETGQSWAEGRWIITETGWMCLNATWHSEQGVFPAKTCFSHRIDNGTIYQKREPGGEWYAFRNAEVHQDDEASKLVSTDLVSRQLDAIKAALGAAQQSEQ